MVVKTVIFEALQVRGWWFAQMFGLWARGLVYLVGVVNVLDGGLGVVQRFLTF